MLRFFYLVGIFYTFFVACEHKEQETATTTFSIDKIHYGIQSITSANEKLTDVSTTPLLTISFSHNVKNSILNEALIFLIEKETNTNVPLVLTLPDGKIVGVSPKELLKENTEYTLLLTKEVQSSEGAVLEKDFAYSLSTKKRKSKSTTLAIAHNGNSLPLSNSEFVLQLPEGSDASEVPLNFTLASNAELHKEGRTINTIQNTATVLFDFSTMAEKQVEVIAADGITKSIYTIKTSMAPSTKADITKLNSLIEGSLYEGQIKENRSIYIRLPVAAAIPSSIQISTLEISKKASSSIQQGASLPLDEQHQALITITSESGKENTYTIKVETAPFARTYEEMIASESIDLHAYLGAFYDSEKHIIKEEGEQFPYDMLIPDYKSKAARAADLSYSISATFGEGIVVLNSGNAKTLKVLYAIADGIYLSNDEYIQLSLDREECYVWDIGKNSVLEVSHSNASFALTRIAKKNTLSQYWGYSFQNDLKNNSFAMHSTLPIPQFNDIQHLRLRIKINAVLHRSDGSTIHLKNPVIEGRFNIEVFKNEKFISFPNYHTAVFQSDTPPLYSNE